MKKTDENYQDYKMYIDIFNESNDYRKKNMLIEFMVRNGYDITNVCKCYSNLKMNQVKRLFKEQLIENLNNK